MQALENAERWSWVKNLLLAPNARINEPEPTEAAKKLTGS
jgi:hypothetical protein